MFTAFVFSSFSVEPPHQEIRRAGAFASAPQVCPSSMFIGGSKSSINSFQPQQPLFSPQLIILSTSAKPGWRRHWRHHAYLCHGELLPSSGAINNRTFYFLQDGEKSNRKIYHLWHQKQQENSKHPSRLANTADPQGRGESSGPRTNLSVLGATKERWQYGSIKYNVSSYNESFPQIINKYLWYRVIQLNDQKMEANLPNPKNSKRVLEKCCIKKNPHIFVQFLFYILTTPNDDKLVFAGVCVTADFFLCDKDSSKKFSVVE